MMIHRNKEADQGPRTLMKIVSLAPVQLTAQKQNLQLHQPFVPS
jgi:hypothetical protein